MNKKDLLIELGFEEIPSSYLKPGIETWLDVLMKIFKKNEIRYKKADYYFTPRRYVLHLIGIEEDTEIKTVEITGPPVSIAKTDNGWTKAAIGFAKSQGKSTEDIYFVKKGKNEVCALKIEKKRKGLDEILRENLVKTVEAIRFPKTMIWENSKFRFARPIRWLLILTDNSVIDLLNVIYSVNSLPSLKVKLFDIYIGKQIPEGKKSMAVNLEFNGLTRTLKDDEVEVVVGKIVESLKEKFGAYLREK